MNTSEPREVEISRKIEDIYPPILLALGIPGNIVSLIVLVRIKNSQTSSYLMFLAGVDLFVICVSLLPNWIGGIVQEDFRDRSSVVCKLHIFAVYASLQISSWTLVLITSERVYSVVYPHRVRALCTKASAMICLFVMVVFMLGLNSHFLFGYHIEFRPHINRSRCITKEAFEYFEFKVWPWMDFLVVFLIPSSVLILGNILIIRKLRINQRFSSDSIRQNSSIAARKSTISFITKMTIILNTVFIICVSPVNIFSIGQPYWWPVDTLTDQGIANLTLSWTCVTMIMYVNNCANFLFYVMFGSKFRDELKRIFRSNCSKSNTRRYSTSQNSVYNSTIRTSLNQTIVLNSLPELLQKQNGDYA